MLKVVESDDSLTSCDNIGKLFMQMFLGNISNQFQLGGSKASCVVSDGRSPCILDETVKNIKTCGTGYTAMFDETTANQNRKQLDVLIRYWSIETKQIVSKCLTFVFFGRASGIDISMNILQTIKETCLPLDKLFNKSSDGPNINKTVWREINDTLKKDFSGIIPQTTCCLHIVHNGFLKGLDMYGKESEELAFDMHYCFKNAPSKREDFLKF